MNAALEGHERQRHWPRSVRWSAAVRRPPVPGTAARFFHHLVHIGAETGARSEAEERDRDADARKERDHHRIDRERHPAGLPGVGSLSIASIVGSGDHGGAHEPADGEFDAMLSQQLPDDSPARRAERFDGNLPRPLR